ncbi:phosphoglycerate kinase [bacterium]|nr:phosphoglycerate kinase [bacterium]
MNHIQNINVKKRKVFLRVDFNVPLDEEGRITDDSRIKAALPTIKHLVQNGAQLIVASHLGRPKGKFNPKMSLKPVQKRLSELLSEEVKMAPDVIGDEVNQMRDELQEGQVLFLENLRFYPGEKENDPSFAQKLAQNVNVYVNDAFGTCHRSHASVTGIPGLVKKKAAGFLIHKELEYLGKAVHSPQKPYVAILGGVKVSDKIPVIDNLSDKADDVLIGGVMAYTFLSALGYGIGRSRVEEDKKEMALQLLEKSKNKNIRIHLPSDHVVAPDSESPAQSQTVNSYPLPSDLMALDIGPQTIKKYSNIISKAKTLFWNGAMGVFEVDAFARGTTEIAKAVAKSPAISIVGGGDSTSALDKAGVTPRIFHVSTGGGASLEFIAKETLPGLEALKEE